MSENENTKNSTEYWRNVFKKWANERKQKTNLEGYEYETLNKTLSQFYAEVRRDNGGQRFVETRVKMLLACKRTGLCFFAQTDVQIIYFNYLPTECT